MSFERVVPEVPQGLEAGVAPEQNFSENEDFSPHAVPGDRDPFSAPRRDRQTHRPQSAVSWARQ